MKTQDDANTLILHNSGDSRVVARLCLHRGEDFGSISQSACPSYLIDWQAASGRQDSVHVGTGGRPGPGRKNRPADLPGRLSSLRTGSLKPIRVSGTVRIYEYTDYDENEDDPQPDHIFQFNDGGWNAHRAEGTLGQTYNVFLPYVKKDKGHAVCALRVEYESEDGRKVSSAFTQVTLASKTSAKPASALRRNIIQNKSNRDATGVVTDMRTESTGQPERKLESTTIKLPPKR